MAPYLGRLGQPTDITGGGVPEPLYVFHGCGNVNGPEVVESFARRGPSIRFARARSYFSAQQAVYWSNSIDFAISWSFFAETGSWDLDKHDGWLPFECLIFVSKLDIASIGSGLYLIPKPLTLKEEEGLTAVSREALPNRD